MGHNLINGAVSAVDVYEAPNNTPFEGPWRLIDDDTGETGGVTTSESMDARLMQNAASAANQH
jgi:hypothetical protein